jgi:alanine dehydrogenase
VTSAGERLTYLSGDDVRACLPPVVEQLDVVEDALVALAEGGAENPPKLYVAPRQGSDYHAAMPACIAAREEVGMKWVATYASNAERGLPYVYGLMLLSDFTTGRPVAVLEGATLTGVRTAAVTGVVLRRLAAGRGRRVALVGAGAQARYHLPVLAATLAPLELVVFDVCRDHAESFCELALRHEGVASAVVAGSLDDAVSGARILITASTHGAGESPIRPENLAADCLLVPIDWGCMVPGETVCAASVFAVDDHAEYEEFRRESCGDDADFDGWPDKAHLSIGEAVVAARRGATPGAGRLTCVAALGVGVADVALAHALLSAAGATGKGTLLPL